jgi:photosystem II stability/assembly factor-like uncharacterized protein
MTHLLRRGSAGILLVALLLAPGITRADAVKVDNETFAGLDPRPIGPAVAGGRIAALDAVHEGEQLTIYVGAAGGGIWKSIDGGMSFKPIFDKYCQSIGDIRVDPSHPKTVWVGTGEPWMRNTVSVGDGIYKSTNGGDDWVKMGLDSTEHISRICIDPKNSDRLFVCVPGHLWDADSHRGIYRTTDGGKSWQRVLFVNNDTGGGDLAMDPSDANTLYASMWQFRRKPWSFASGGPGSGLYKTTDGGNTWKKLTNGIPPGTLGRITLDVSPANTKRVYAVIEHKNAALYRSDDAGESWQYMNNNSNITVRPFYFGRIVAHPSNADKVYKPSLGLSYSEDGGKTFSGIGGSFHGDLHALWLDPQRPKHMILGTDGGVFISEDGGNNWRDVLSINAAQTYHVAFDMERPYNIYTGLQDNGTWMGPSDNADGIMSRHWRSLDGGDGFWALVDPKDPDFVYTESQGGRLSRYKKSVREQKSVAPMQKIGDPKLRYNWNTPMHFGATTGRLYFGSQFLYRSSDHGEHWERLGGDMSTNDPAKQKQEESGGVSVDNSSAENHCTIFTICESPKDPTVIWAGTDDGNVQVSRDDGKTWTNAVKNIPGLPANTWCSKIDASPFDAATAFASFDGHATGDMKTYLYKTSDYGKTWTSLVVPEMRGYAHAIKQDLVNPNLLFAGTEFGFWISLDGGKQWGQMAPPVFPYVAVRDFAIHPRDGDLLIATHGRGIYILDDLTPLRALTPDKLDQDVVMLPARPGVATVPAGEQRFDGDVEFVGRPLFDGATINYYLKKRHLIGDLKIEISDDKGNVITTMPGGKRRGINRVFWQNRMKPPRTPASVQVIRSQGAFMGPRVPAGDYTVKLIKNKDTFTSKVTVVPDPRANYTAADRALQHETAMKLYGMMSDLTYTHDAALDTRREATDRLAKLPAKDSGRKAVQALIDQGTDLRNTLSAQREGFVTGEEQLREKLGGLYGAVNYFDGAPTGSQLDNLKLMEKQLTDAGAKLQSIFAKELVAANSALTRAKLDPIKPLSREDWDKKESGGAGSGASGGWRDPDFVSETSDPR